MEFRERGVLMNVGWVRISRVLFRGEQEKPAKHFRNDFTTYRNPV